MVRLSFMKTEIFFCAEYVETWMLSNLLLPKISLSRDNISLLIFGAFLMVLAGLKSNDRVWS